MKTIRITTLALLALSALALAACGAKPNAADKRQSDEDLALKFAQCMREHGVQMEDPQTNGKGGIMIRAHRAKGAPGEGPRTDGPPPAFQKAQQACRKYMPNGGKPPSKAEQQQEFNKELAFSKCMRQHGVNMPDPQLAGDGGITMKMQDGRVNPDSPAFKAAQSACDKGAGTDHGGMMQVKKAGP